MDEIFTGKNLKKIKHVRRMGNTVDRPHGDFRLLLDNAEVQEFSADGQD
jgi:hypothetical protein